MCATTGMPACRQRRDLLGHPLTALELDRLRTRLFHGSGWRSQRACWGLDLVAAERQIGDDEGVLSTPDHRAQPTESAHRW